MKRIIVSMLLGMIMLSTPKRISIEELCTYETEIVEVEETEMVVDVMSMDRPVLKLPIQPIQPEPEEPQYISLGTFLVTAYCSCEICCDHYALNRPVDENGNEIVKGAAQQVLTPEYSIAVDTRVIPFGTKVYFDGKEHLAQDRGGSIKNKRIDLYFSDHQRALEWGKQYHEIFILVESE